jgi:DNA-binding response OmpR family regulator
MNSEKHPYTILFVEDEQALRHNYVIYLRRYFENVYEAEDGESAFKIYKEKKPHILIVDINIPKLNGIDLLKKIRENDHTTKAIILSAHSDVEFLLSATSLKLTQYLVKPISRQELQDALSLVLQELSMFDISSKQTLKLKDNFHFDKISQEIFNESKNVILTSKEKALFTCLASNPKQTFSYDELISSMWIEYDDYGSLDSLKTIIKNLRKKLPKDTIKNIFGIGYTLEVQ